MDKIRESLLKKSVASKIERRGKAISLVCLALIVGIVFLIFYFVASRGLATFFQNHINLWQFLSGTQWNPGTVGTNGQPAVGALPMIVGSFLITILSAFIATPFAIGTAVFMTEISPRRGAKILRPVTELLVGIPSVVYGFIGLQVVVPFVRNTFGGSG